MPWLLHDTQIMIRRASGWFIAEVKDLRRGDVFMGMGTAGKAALRIERGLYVIWQAVGDPDFNTATQEWDVMVDTIEIGPVVINGRE